MTPPGCGVTCATTPFGTLGFNEEFLFRSAPIVLAGVPPPTGWVFYWDNICCRNNVDNLTNEVNMLIRSKMFSYNGQNANPCFDSSPYFAERPTSFLCIGYEFNYNNAGFDSNMDSLSYGWDNPFDGNTGWANAVPCQFSAPYSISSPIPGSPHLDSTNGQLTIFPQTGVAPQGNFATVIRINSYRCNQKIAEVYREIQLSLSTACAFTLFGVNIPPQLTPPPFQDSTGIYNSYETIVFVGDTVTATLSIQELDISLNGSFQVASLDGVGTQFATNYSNTPPDNCNRPPCAYFTDVSSPYPVLIPPILTTPLPIRQVRFFWPTNCSHVIPDSCNNGNSTYHFILRLKDDACPVPAYNARTISVTVKGPTIIVNGDTLHTDFPNGTLQWYLNGNPIPGEIGSTHITTAVGNYTVVATLPGSGCQISSPGIIAGTSSINSLKSEGMDLYIYPNPANDQISVAFSSLAKSIADLVIVDVSGRKVLQKTINISAGNNIVDISLASLQKGLYIIKLSTSETELIKKLVIE